MKVATSAATQQQIKKINKRPQLALDVAFKTISSMKKFDLSWPASIIYKCKKYSIYIDKIVKS